MELRTSYKGSVSNNVQLHRLYGKVFGQLKKLLSKRKNIVSDYSN